MRRLSIVLAVFAMTFAVIPAATAHRSMLHAEYGGVGMPDFNPDALADRCPDRFEWVYNTQGAGTMETAQFSGEFEAVGQHCSRWLTGPPTDPHDWYLGQVGNGVLTFDTAEGDLVVRYRGIFRFQGDVSTEPPNFVSHIWLFYKIDGEASTEIFAGARGFGWMRVIDTFDEFGPSFTSTMDGPIRFAK